MMKGDALDGDVADGALRASDEFHQGGQYGYDSLADGLAFAWHVIDLVLADVVIPFAGLVQ